MILPQVISLGVCGRIENYLLRKMKNFWDTRIILPSITTTSKSNWREKIQELSEIKLKEFCFFPTCLDEEERKEAYKLLGKLKIDKIPFVHIRSDMGIEELDFFVDKYGTEVFNTHSKSEFSWCSDYSKYKDVLFVENVYNPLNEEEIREVGGICLDISHLENDRRFGRKKFQHDVEIIEKYKIGCNHISAIKETTHVDEKNFVRYDIHLLSDLSELDYIKKYPASYFSPYIALELENTLKEQLEAREYIIDLLKNKI